MPRLRQTLPSTEIPGGGPSAPHTPNRAAPRPSALRRGRARHVCPVGPGGPRDRTRGRGPPGPARYRLQAPSAPANRAHRQRRATPLPSHATPLPVPARAAP